MPRRKQIEHSNSGAVLRAAAPYSGWLTLVRYRALERLRSLMKRPAYTIAFLPSRPQAQHLIWGANQFAGGRIIKNPHKADAVFYFDEKVKACPPRRPNPLVPGFNFFCSDVSQARIADNFEEIFGYAVAANPEEYIGSMAAKSKRQGMTKISIVDAPCPAASRMSYQRLIDNEIHRGYVVEFTCAVVKGEVPLVYVAMRPAKQRFGKRNKSAAIVQPEEVFTSDELEKISRFCAAMGLDWGGLDILRDKNSGQMFIVDVSRAELTPPHGLLMKDRLRSTRILGQALREAIIDQPGIIPRAIPISTEAPAAKADNDDAPEAPSPAADLDIVPVRISS